MRGKTKDQSVGRYRNDCRPGDDTGANLRVRRIGARGDGIAETESGPVYLPYTAPGDLVAVGSGSGAQRHGTRAEAMEILELGPNRTEPICPHFMKCGGCALQHLTPSAIATEKRRWLIDALARQGFDGAAVRETETAPAGTRRRARFAYVRTARSFVLGYNRRRDRHIVDIAACPVLRPEIEALLPDIRSLASSLRSLGKAGEIQVTAVETGIELVFFPKAGTEPGFEEREALVGFARERNIARIAWAGQDEYPEPVFADRALLTSFNRTTVELPPASFLQPSAPGEALIRDAIADGLPDRPTRLAIADLFAGCGTFGLPFAAMGHKVLAVEGDDASVRAIRNAAGNLPIQGERRDLFRNPLEARELARFDVVIFDPPRAGAASQVEQLAASDVPRVVAVSCNPATLARDLRTLVDGGYCLDRAIPIDQFTWAAHLEAVCVLSRP